MTKSEELQYGFNTGASMAKTIFNMLPILPAPPISMKDLAKKLGKSSRWMNDQITHMPTNAPIYEGDHYCIGRVK